MSDLPIHPITGLQALGVTRRGPIWPVIGASQDDPSNGGAQKPATGEQGKQQPSGDEPLGEGGKKALETERAARKAADTKAGDLQRQIDDLTAKLAAATAEPDNRSELDKRLETMQAQIDAATNAQKKSDEAAATANLAQLRVERGALKGLAPALAKKLTATTAEEIDAEIDADFLPHLAQVRPGMNPNPQQGQPSAGRASGTALGNAEADRRFGTSK